MEYIESMHALIQYFPYILLISCIDSIYSIYIVNLKENDIQTLHALIQYIPYILLISCIDSIYSIYILSTSKRTQLSKRTHIVNLKEDAICQPQRGRILSTSR